jgi:hypothetical protein
MNVSISNQQQYWFKGHCTFTSKEKYYSSVKNLKYAEDFKSRVIFLTFTFHHPEHFLEPNVDPSWASDETDI